MVGIDPADFTLRELVEMYRGKLDFYAPLHLLCCVTFNVNRDPKKTKALTLADFNPWIKRSKGSHRFPLNKQTISMLKVFLSN